MQELISKIMVVIILVMVGIYSATITRRTNKEQIYKTYFAEKALGKVNAELPDKSTIDILTKLYVIDVAYADDWDKIIGKVLYSSIITNKLPGIVIIVDDKSKEKDVPLVRKLLYVAKTYGIQVWLINNKFQIYTI